MRSEPRSSPPLCVHQSCHITSTISTETAEAAFLRVGLWASSQVVMPLLRVLEKMHRMKLIHRDIKVGSSVPAWSRLERLLCCDIKVPV